MLRETVIHTVTHSTQTGGDVGLWSNPLAPALLAGLVALIVFAGGQIASFVLQKRSSQDAARLARDRFDFDKSLAERKAELDRQTALIAMRAAAARTMLRQFYEVRSIMVAVRSPMAYSHEAEDRQGRDQESPDIRANVDRYWPVLRRLNADRDKINDFYAQRYDARALFGGEIEAAYSRVWQAVAQMKVAAEALMRVPSHTEQDMAFRDRMEARVWEGLIEPDPILAILDQAVADAEATFGPAIRVAAG